MTSIQQLTADQIYSLALAHDLITDQQETTVIRTQDELEHVLQEIRRTLDEVFGQ